MRIFQTKKIVSMLILGFILLSNNIESVNAATTVPDKNNSGLEVTKKGDNLYVDGVIYYDSADEAYKAGLKQNDKKRIMGNHSGSHFGLNGWVKTKTSKYNTAYDKDELNCRSKALKTQTLVVSSKTTVKITGSTKFNFAEFAELELSMEIGKEWGKTKEHKIEPEKGYKYLLESYLVVKRRDYTYYDEDSNAKAHASSHDKVKAVVNFTEKKLK